MPQASQRLRNKFPRDTEAFEVLEGKIKVSRGGVIMWATPDKPTAHEMDAIQYLCDEWDYGFDDSIL